ncbi:MAG: MFS transporter, partial [Beijerinckiaceae bacterium]
MLRLPCPPVLAPVADRRPVSLADGHGCAFFRHRLFVIVVPERWGIAMALEMPIRFERIGRVATTRPLSDYLAGRFFAMVGAWTFRVTVGWIVWTMTKSPAMVGLATAAMLGPQVLLGPVSGVLADSRDRRRLLAVTHVFNGGAKILAGFCVLGGLIGIWGLFGFILVAG